MSRELEDPNLWQEPNKAQKLNREKMHLETTLNDFEALENGLADACALVDAAIEEGDEATLSEIADEIDDLQASLERFEFQRMFSGQMDANNAFVDIQSGSGGTEAQDWAEMLLRLYLRWGESKGFNTQITELSEGDVAGIKSATVYFEGEYAFGWLRTETGVHRLVRKSPFDANNKRHTSFASIFVSPEIDDRIQIDIDNKDLRIDTYRASGKGGQHVNTTDSAIRITHLPTGIVVQSQAGRSQHSNKDQAMQQLRAKLYELEMQKRRQEQAEQEASKSDIGWGSQIRSYVLDESRIKDLRTGVEVRHTKPVLDGDIDRFIIASLKADL